MPSKKFINVNNAILSLMQAPCQWSDTTGRKLTLTPISMVTMCDKERQVLQIVAVASLQAMKLGLHLPKLKSK